MTCNLTPVPSGKIRLLSIYALNFPSGTSGDVPSSGRANYSTYGETQREVISEWCGRIDDYERTSNEESYGLL